MLFRSAAHHLAGCHNYDSRMAGEERGVDMNTPSPKTDLIERLCHSLAFHVVESELTLEHSEGFIEEWADECRMARALISEAGFDIDKLYPILDRPTVGSPQ